MPPHSPPLSSPRQHLAPPLQLLPLRLLLQPLTGAMGKGQSQPPFRPPGSSELFPHPCRCLCSIAPLPVQVSKTPARTLRFRALGHECIQLQHLSKYVAEPTTLVHVTLLGTSYTAFVFLSLTEALCWWRRSKWPAHRLLIQEQIHTLLHTSYA